MKVQDLMTREVETCDPATNLATVAMIMWRRDCGIVPVVDRRGILVGLVTDRDICIAVATRHRTPEALTAAEVMTGAIFSVRPEDDARRALETMRIQKVRRVPVLDAEDRLRGMLSINDLVLAADSSGARRKGALSADEVFHALHGICEHRPSLLRPAPHDELATA
jgi:CBS domain-containing protein